MDRRYDVIEVLSQHLYGSQGKSMKNIPKVAFFTAEIQTMYYLHTNQTNLLVQLACLSLLINITP